MLKESISSTGKIAFINKFYYVKDYIDQDRGEVSKFIKTLFGDDYTNIYSKHENIDLTELDEFPKIITKVAQIKQLKTTIFPGLIQISFANFKNLKITFNKDDIDRITKYFIDKPIIYDDLYYGYILTHKLAIANLFNNSPYAEKIIEPSEFYLDYCKNNLDQKLCPYSSGSTQEYALVKGFSINKSAEFEYNAQVDALKLGAPYEIALMFQNNNQLDALKLGAPYKIALEFKNFEQIIALELGALYKEALKFQNYYQTKALELGAPYEIALLFQNNYQLEALKFGVPYECALTFDMSKYLKPSLDNPYEKLCNLNTSVIEEVPTILGEIT